MKYMDQTRTGGASGQPAAAGNDPAKRIIGGDLPEAETGGGCFDCNICLDCAAEPVVTLCGHLYCWPCIYEWLRPDADTSRASARRQCPVCKATVSPDALVPLYGRGGSSSSKKPPRGSASIPRRPAVRPSAQGSENTSRPHRSVETDAASRQPQEVRDQVSAAQFDALLPPPFGDRGMMHSTAGGVLGGMAVAVLPWALRGQVQPPSMYYSSSYYLNPRQRRRHMELERSLHQIWFFLFVFVLLCLLLF